MGTVRARPSALRRSPSNALYSVQERARAICNEVARLSKMIARVVGRSWTAPLVTGRGYTKDFRDRGSAPRWPTVASRVCLHSLSPPARGSMRLVVLRSPGGYGERRRVASPNGIVYNSERMQCCEADKQPAQPTATRPSATAADLEIASVARDAPDLQAHTVKAHRLAVPARVPQRLRSQSLAEQ